MKILYFLTNYPYYSETFVSEEIRQLQQAGHDIIVCNFTWYKSEQDQHKELVLNNTKNPFKLGAAIFQKALKGRSHIFRFKTWNYIAQCIWKRPSFFLKYLYLLFSLDYMTVKVSQQDFQLAVSHFLFKSTLAGFFICDNLNKKYHIRLHTKRNLYSNSVLKDVLISADAVTAESKDVGVFYENVIKRPHTIKVVRQSIDFLKLTSIPKVISESVYINIVAIGRLVEKKGFHILFEALHKKQTQFKSKIRCSIYGDGPLESKLSLQINQLGLQDFVTLQGREDHSTLMQILAKADLLVVPSIELEKDIDGVPTVIAEAMSVKTPVIATRIGGISELIEDKVTGFITEPNNSNALSIYLEQLLEADLRNSVVSAATIKVKDEYDHTLARELGLET